MMEDSEVRAFEAAYFDRYGVKCQVIKKQGWFCYSNGDVTRRMRKREMIEKTRIWQAQEHEVELGGIEDDS